MELKITGARVQRLRLSSMVYWQVHSQRLARTLASSSALKQMSQPSSTTLMKIEKLKKSCSKAIDSWSAAMTIAFPCRTVVTKSDCSICSAKSSNYFHYSILIRKALCKPMILTWLTSQPSTLAKWVASILRQVHNFSRVSVTMNDIRCQYPARYSSKKVKWGTSTLPIIRTLRRTT